MKKVHLLHSKLNYHACGVGNKHSVTTTANSSEVTCERCLMTIAGQKVSPGRNKSGNAKISVTIRLPKHLVEWIDAQKDKGDRTQIIVEALKASMKKPNRKETIT